MRERFVFPEILTHFNLSDKMQKFSAAAVVAHETDGGRTVRSCHQYLFSSFDTTITSFTMKLFFTASLVVATLFVVELIGTAAGSALLHRKAEDEKLFLTR